MSANLGKISITAEGDHVTTNSYDRLSLVKATSGAWYLSIYDVPTNIDISNQGYWAVFFDPVMNSQQVADNAQAIVGLVQSVADNTQGILDLSSVYVTLSAVSTATNPNTIVKRDSSGNINANIFRSEYDTTNASCNYFMTQIDTDSNNYIRPSTPAQVKVALGIRSITYQKRGAFGNARIHYIYPPTGYTMANMTGCAVWPSILHMNGTTLDTSISVTYEATRITITTHDYIYGVGYNTSWEKIG